MWFYLLQGILFGFAAAAQPGPLQTYIISQALARGWKKSILAAFAPLAAVVIQLAVTRSREIAADTTGAQLSGKPLALASALQKLESGGRALAQRGVGGVPAETSSAYSSLYIAAPFGGRGQISNWFRTHPKTEDRVRNLHNIARRMGQIA